MGTAAERLVRLAAAADVMPAGAAGDNEVTTVADATGPTKQAKSLQAGDVISHDDKTNGKKVAVVKVANRSTHIEIIGKHVANGRGVVLKSKPSEAFNVHPADISGETDAGSNEASNGPAGSKGMAKTNLPGPQVSTMLPGAQYN